MKSSVQLYRTVAVAAFGRNSRHPFRSSLLRLGGLCSLAAGLSWLLAKGLADLTPIASPNGSYLVFAAALAMQLAVLFVLLSSLGITRSNNTDTLARLLLLLPVSNMQRWLALLLPSLLLAAVAAVLVAWPVASFLSKAGLHPLLFTLGGFTGVITALGMLHGIPRRQFWVQVAGVPLVIWGEYRLVGVINNTASSGASQLAALLVLLCVFGGLCVLFFRSNKHLANDISLSTPGKNVRGASLPVGSWFAKKIARAKTTQLGFMTAFGISLFAAIIFWRQKIDPYLSIVLASVLAATFTSDIRSLARHTQPAEITALRATTRFVAAHITAAWPCALAAASPLIAGAAIATGADIVLTGFSAQLLFGISAGVFAGTLIVPARRDIMGQLLATLLSVGILLIIPYLPVVKTLGAAGMAIFMFALALFLLAASWAIEYHRNYYTWR